MIKTRFIKPFGHLEVAVEVVADLDQDPEW